MAVTGVDTGCSKLALTAAGLTDQKNLNHYRSWVPQIPGSELSDFEKIPYLFSFSNCLEMYRWPEAADCCCYQMLWNEMGFLARRRLYIFGSGNVWQIPACFDPISIKGVLFQGIDVIIHKNQSSCIWIKTAGESTATQYSLGHLLNHSGHKINEFN